MGCGPEIGVLTCAYIHTRALLRPYIHTCALLRAYIHTCAVLRAYIIQEFPGEVMHANCLSIRRPSKVQSF